MTQADIPQDVMGRAREIANEAIRAAFRDPLMPMEIDLQATIARAIMAERDALAAELEKVRALKGGAS